VSTLTGGSEKKRVGLFTDGRVYKPVDRRHAGRQRQAILKSIVELSAAGSTLLLDIGRVRAKFSLVCMDFFWNSWYHGGRGVP